MTLEIVLLSTPATPPTSFCRRDWITPVFVFVKNASSMRWRWVNRRMRSEPMTELPTVAVRYVCQTPSPADSTHSPTMIATSVTSTGTLGCPCFGNRPTSKSWRVSSGGATLSAALTSTSTMVTVSAVRCGRNSSPIRRSRCSTLGACALRSRWLAASLDPIGRPPPRILTTSP